jgi:O-antigen/teichoic acid export membrane protein
MAFDVSLLAARPGPIMLAQHEQSQREAGNKLMSPAGILRGLSSSLKDPLRRNSLFLLATHVVIALIGFFFWRIAKGEYGDEAVGVATSLVSAVLLIHSLARLGLDVGLIRFLPDEADKPGMMNTSLTIVGLLSAVLALVFVMGVGLWAEKLVFVRDNAWYAVLFIAFAVVTALVELLRQGVFVAYRRTQASLAVEVLGGLRLPLVLAFLSIGAYGIFVAWGLGGVVALAAGIALVLLAQRTYRPVPTIRRDVVGKMLRFSLGNYAAETLRELPGFVLPIIVLDVFTAKLGDEAGKPMAAYFYIAWTIASVVMMISYATGSSLLAEGSVDPRKFGSSTVKAMRFMLLLLVAAIIIVFLAGGWVLSLFDEKYAENAFPLLRVLTVSGIPMAINTIYVTQKRIERKMWPVVLIYAFVACFTLGVGYALMNRMDDEPLLGIGIAWLVSNSLVAVVVGGSMTRSWLQARRNKSQGSADASTS